LKIAKISPSQFSAKAKFGNRNEIRKIKDNNIFLFCSMNCFVLWKDIYIFVIYKLIKSLSYFHFVSKFFDNKKTLLKLEVFFYFSSKSTLGS
jgi:hypothetical protein